MKKQAFLFALLVVISAMFGSFFTYSYFLKHPVLIEAQPTVTQNPEKTEQVPLYGGIVGSEAVINAVKKLSPSVVYITTKSVFNPRKSIENQIPQDIPEEFRRFFLQPYDEPQERVGSGSGIIISSDGVILTNQHVIEGADQIIVAIDKGDGGKEKTYKAKVIGVDKLTDIAVIKVDAEEDLPAATLGDSDKASIGEWVIAVGNPYGYEHSVTIGVLSAKGRDLSGMGREYPNLLQTDAAINPGNSGGPLANLNGEVIGVNTAIHRYGQGIGFAIPINRVKEIMKDLVDKGKVIRPYIGINMMEMDEAKAKYLEMPLVEGVLVYQTIPHSPADKAGLKRGDVILEVNGKKVNSPSELQKLVRAHKVGDTVKLKIWRDKRKHDIELKVEEMPAEVNR